MATDSIQKFFVLQKILINLFLFFFLLCVPSTTFAHKVNIFAYVEADTVYTESYFPDGTKVKEGTVEIYDNKGNKLLEGKTDEEGQFNFKIPKRDDLRIVINASLGHKNSYLLSKNELPQNLSTQRVSQKLVQKEVKQINEINSEQIRDVVEASLDEKLKPIMRELKKLEQKKVTFTDVVGGIGYIFGIMGIILYFLSQKKKV